MMSVISTTRYTKTAVFLHWLIALCIFGMFALGWFMSDIPKEAAKQTAFDLFNWGVYTWNVPEAITPRSFYFNVHKSIGVSIIGLVIIRILWRITHKPPAMLASYKVWERKLATSAHHLLYLLMVAMPVSGLIMATYSKYGVKWFGMPLIKGLDNEAMRLAFKNVHGIIGFILLAIVAVHILGALKHKIVDKDDTIKRMSP